MSDQNNVERARKAAETRRARALAEQRRRAAIAGGKPSELQSELLKRQLLIKQKGLSGMSDADLIAVLEAEAEAMAGPWDKYQSPATDGPWTRYAEDRGQQTGMVGQTMSGVNEGIAGILGAPVDLMTGAINMGKQGVNALAG
ncbi:hypothetical protein, partial [Sulfitobacter sp. HI0054]|uniref:hypothetical protein n=2 Tax=unclassified Sulfitobacter TaxID=196795 RepID=UPI0012E93CA9